LFNGLTLEGIALDAISMMMPEAMVRQTVAP
jgi:hypothetical protein